MSRWRPVRQSKHSLPRSNTDRLDDDAFSHHLAALTRGTVLAGRDLDYLAAETAECLETLLVHWRAEYREMLERAAAAAEPEVQAALSNRAKRMRGEFLLGELARRGFTPAYGFPVDVVSFDHLSGHERDGQDGAPVSSHMASEGAEPPARWTSPYAEYAPGAEVVVDGLVHLSEGVLPAWGALSDASGLEDLQHFWECGACRAFGLARIGTGRLSILRSTGSTMAPHTPTIRLSRAVVPPIPAMRASVTCHTRCRASERQARPGRRCPTRRWGGCGQIRWDR